MYCSGQLPVQYWISPVSTVWMSVLVHNSIRSVIFQFPARVSKSSSSEASVSEGSKGRNERLNMENVENCFVCRTEVSGDTRQGMGVGRRVLESGNGSFDQHEQATNQNGTKYNPVTIRIDRSDGLTI